MWAMKLWDEGYKRITKEMIREQPADDSELVRGGSAGLAEAGNIGINLQDLSRSITNLVAPMPVVVDTTQASSESKQPRQHSAASSSRAGSGGQAGDCSSNGPLGAFYVAQVESISSESPPPTNASLVPIENHPESNDEKAESGETGSTELKGLLGTGLMDGITVPKVLDGLSLHRYSAPQTPNDTTATFRKSLSDISHKSSAPELSAVAGAKPYFHGPSEGTSILMEAYDPASKNDAYMGGITGDSGLTESQQARSPHIQRRRTAEDQREQNQTTPPKAPEPGGRPGSKDQVPPAELTSCRQQLGAQQQVKEALESREDVEAPPIGALTQPQPHFLDGQQLQQPGNWGSPLAALAFQQHRFPPAYHQHAASALQLPAGAVEIDLQTEITWGNLIGEGGFGKVRWLQG